MLVCKMKLKICGLFLLCLLAVVGHGNAVESSSVTGTQKTPGMQRREAAASNIAHSVTVPTGSGSGMSTTTTHTHKKADDDDDDMMFWTFIGIVLVLIIASLILCWCAAAAEKRQGEYTPVPDYYRG